MLQYLKSSLSNGTTPPREWPHPLQLPILYEREGGRMKNEKGWVEPAHFSNMVCVEGRWTASLLSAAIARFSLSLSEDVACC